MLSVSLSCSLALLLSLSLTLSLSLQAAIKTIMASDPGHPGWAQDIATQVEEGELFEFVADLVGREQKLW